MESHAFADRIIRIRKSKNTLTEAVMEELSTDPSLLAAQNVSLLARKVKAFKIGKPRASQMYKGCIRFHVIGTNKGYHKKEWSTVKGRIVFGMGNALHYWVQNTDDIFEDSRRVGWWECQACKKVWHFGTRPQKKCTKCGAQPFASIYYEHILNLSGTYPVGGHPDLFLLFKGGVLRIVEIKTINGEDFVKLKGPLVDHEWQVQTYMWGCSLDRTLPMQVDSDLGYVLYISKKAVKDFPMKMFPVRKSKNIIREVKEKIKIYRRGIKHYPKKLPDLHRECERGNMGNYRAKQCACRKECLKYG